MAAAKKKAARRPGSNPKPPAVSPAPPPNPPQTIVEAAIAASAQADPFVTMVERIVANPNVDADKLEKVLDVNLRLRNEQARIEFNGALARVEEALPTVVRDAQNDHTNSRYARHETIARAIRPIYAKEGFSTSFTQDQCPIEGYLRIKGYLRHSAGHTEEYFIDLPLDQSGARGNTNKTALHAAGSTFTYGRRYLTCLMFDVAVGDDTDGNLPPPPPLTDQEVADLYAKAEELYGPERVRRLLEKLAKQYFQIKSGDYTLIPSYRFRDALRILEEGPNEPAQVGQ